MKLRAIVLCLAVATLTCGCAALREGHNERQFKRALKHGAECREAVATVAIDAVDAEIQKRLGSKLIYGAGGGGSIGLLWLIRAVTKRHNNTRREGARA